MEQTLGRAKPHTSALAQDYLEMAHRLDPLHHICVLEIYDYDVDNIWEDNGKYWIIDVDDDDLGW